MELHKRTERLLAFAQDLLRVHNYSELMALTRKEIEATTVFHNVWLQIGDSANPTQMQLVQIDSDINELAHAHATVLNVAADEFYQSVIANPGPTVVADARTDPRTDKDLVELFEARTIICVPLRLFSEPFAILGVGSFGDEGPLPIDVGEVEHLTMLAPLLAVAVSRVMYEQERDEETMQLRSILEASIRYSIVGTDESRLITSWNEGARRNYGYEPDEIIGKPATLLSDPSAAAEAAALFDEADKGLAEASIDRIRRNGAVFKAHVVVTRRSNRAGRHLGYLLMSHDITKEVEAADALRDSIAYNRSLLEANMDPLAAIDSNGIITDVNEATVNAAQVPRTQLIGAELAAFAVDADSIRGLCRRAFEGEALSNIPFTLRLPDGATANYLVGLSPFHNAEGKVVGVLAAGRDVSAILHVVTFDEMVKITAEWLAELNEKLGSLTSRSFPEGGSL